MAEILVDYQQPGLVSLKHTENGIVLFSDIPLENGGAGQQFCPGDMLIGALAACSLLTMGEMAQAREKSIVGTQIKISYESASHPNRIGKITMNIVFPKSVLPEDRPRFLGAIKACPIHNSLNPEIVLEVNSN